MKKEKSKISVKDLEQQVGELTEALQRERADAENIRRRHSEQMSELQAMVKVQVVEQLLPAIDNLERSLKHVPKDLEDNEYVKGVQSVAKHFDKVLSDLGVSRIKTINEVFDPALHEAVGMEEGDGEIEIVCEELQSGYRLGDAVIRHAMVKVKPQEIDKK
jgi:molecular chaperone GrpE